MPFVLKEQISEFFTYTTTTTTHTHTPFTRITRNHCINQIACGNPATTKTTKTTTSKATTTTNDEKL